MVAVGQLLDLAFRVGVGEAEAKEATKEENKASWDPKLGIRGSKDALDLGLI